MLKAKILLAVLSVVFIKSASAAEQTRVTFDKVLEINTDLIKNDRTIGKPEKARILNFYATQFLTPISFFYADEILNVSLDVDSKNKTTLFLKKLIAPLMLNKGILTRIRPLVRAKANAAQYSRFVNQDFPASSLRDFLTAGPENISTERQAQDHLISTLDAWEDLRTFTKSNANLEFDVVMNSLTGDINNALRACKVYKKDQTTYVFEACKNLKGFRGRVSSAELVTIQSMAAGAQIAQLQFVSYDATGVMDLMNRIDNKYSRNGRSVTTKEVVEEMRKENQLGRLLHGQMLKVIPRIGLEIASATKWAMRYERNLCPKNEPSQDNRSGYVQNEGLCARYAMSKAGMNADNGVIANLEFGLKGGVFQNAVLENNGRRYTTAADITAIYKKPVSDLKSLLPTRFSRDGQKAIDLEDRTFGGVLPKADADKVLQSLQEIR